MNGYKVVRNQDGVRVSAIVNYDYKVIYTPNIPTEAPSGTKLFFFKSKFDAEKFMYEQSRDLELWSCTARRCEPSRVFICRYFQLDDLNRYWQSVKEKVRLRPGYTYVPVSKCPDGSYWADSITILEKVEYQYWMKGL